MRNPFPTALAIPLMVLAGAAYSADQAPVHRAAVSTRPAHSPSSTSPAATRPAGKQARALDLSAPNFSSPLWQERLQGPTIDRSLDYVQVPSVIITPSPGNKSNTTVAPVGLGSMFWALRHPADSWRILMPSEPGTEIGDELDTETQLKLAYNDPLSDCPGFPGTPNIRPICP